MTGKTKEKRAAQWIENHPTATGEVTAILRIIWIVRLEGSGGVGGGGRGGGAADVTSAVTVPWQSV